MGDEIVKGRIIRIAGSVIEADNVDSPKMNDIVRVGKDALIGEIIKITGDKLTIQVYEDTTGLRVGEMVENTHAPLSVKLGPGLIGSTFDGIQRPLDQIQKVAGDFIKKGVYVNALDMRRKWKFIPKAKNGETVSAGDILGEIRETELISHEVMVPIGLNGVLSELKEGEFSLDEKFAFIQEEGSTVKVPLTLFQNWPVRKPRPVREKEPAEMPLITGQRVIDSLFPVAKGGTASMPGPFGSGKTIIAHQLAKWSDADIIVYIGCGERGNEMTEILTTFPTIKDPKSGRSLMERTILIANTSDMPVAAREASIYTGVSIAEYYRDMGYDVAVMADSTSRWAEALREISGRLEEMPGEEGFPAYLSTRIAEFYERAGRVKTLGGKTGSITIVGAVSPPGGDISEPVSQATLRTVRVFWALDSSLANARHFPAINWLNSYSQYEKYLQAWYAKEFGEDWAALKKEISSILAKEAEINEIVQLVGYDALAESDKLVIDVAKVIREDFLQQNAYDDVDTFSSMKKQYLMLNAIGRLFLVEKEAVDGGAPVSNFQGIKAKEMLAKMKFVKDDEMETYIRQYEKALGEVLTRK